MTRAEANDERARLAAGDPHSVWAVREREPGDWIVVRAHVAGLPLRDRTLTPVVRASPEPPRPEEDVPPRPEWLAGGG